MKYSKFLTQKIKQMKQTIFYSRFRLASLVFAFVVLFTSCDNNEDESLSDINRVSMKTLPQVNYVLDSALDLTNMVITIDRNGNIIDIPFSSFGAEGITTEPENGKILDLSDKSIIIKIGDSGEGLIQPIIVTNDVVNVEIKNATEVEYVSGQKLNLEDLILSLSYENGDVKEVPYAEFSDEIITTPAHGEVLSSSNSEVELTITHVVSKLNVIQVLSLEPFFPLSGSLVSGPEKTTYTVGDILDLKGTVIKYTLFSGTVINVDVEDFEGFGLSSNPTNGAILKATNTKVTVRHFLFGAQVNINLTIQ